MFHLVSFWWFRKTQVIPELDVDYNVGGILDIVVFFDLVVFLGGYLFLVGDLFRV